MGFKSSFPALALFHHVVVQEAARLAGLDSFTSYVILGDDVVIASKQVADHYKEIMSDLGMVISMHKSVAPYSSDLSGAEFCSRLALNGVEVTGLPVKAIVECISEPKGIPSL